MKRFRLTSNPSTIKSESLLRSSRSPPSLSRTASSTRCFASQPRRTRPGASATDSTDLGRHFYLNKVLEQWAARPATRMTLRQLVFFGKTLGRDRDKILKSANYVRQELPIRIAHRIRDLQALPFVVMSNKHLEEVYNKYWHAFETFRKLPIIKNMEENEKFCELLKELLEDHLTIIPSLTIGIVESSNHLPSEQLDGFMERMLRSRISRRVLAEQHISLSDALDDPFHFFNDPSPPSNSNHSIGSSNDGSGGVHSSQGDLASINHLDSDLDIGDHVGIIYTHLSVASVVRKGVKLLTEMFKEELIGDHNGLTREEAEKCIPEIVLDGDLGARFAYIPEHLEYIIFELLKNAMRATMKRDYKLWDQIPIRVTIVEGPPDEDVIIRISDSGGGLPDLVSKLQGPSAASNPATMMTRHSSHSPLTGALPNTITQTSSTSAGAVGLPASEVQAASLTAAIASTEPSSPSTGISPSSSSGSGTVPTSTNDALKLAAAPTGPTREFDFELDHSDQAFYGSDGSAGAPISPHQAAPSDSSFLTQWPFTPTPVGPQVNNDPLVDVLCSFSNVRRRLEIEERDRLMSIFEEEDMDANEESKLEKESKSKSNNNYEARKSWWNGNLVRDNEVGLGSRDRMDALRNVGTFKGTVKEQVLPSQRIPVPKSSQSSNPSQAETSINPSSPISSLPSSSSSNSNARSNRDTFNLGPTDGTGPMALRNLKAETGLGLPMTKVYCDFFGGSLSFRSLDGHSTDVYVRLPKLGTKKETIEEIVL